MGGKEVAHRVRSSRTQRKRRSPITKRCDPTDDCDPLQIGITLERRRDQRESLLTARRQIGGVRQELEGERIKRQEVLGGLINEYERAK
jgi:hypothetical protein